MRIFSITCKLRCLSWTEVLSTTPHSSSRGLTTIRGDDNCPNEKSCTDIYVPEFVYAHCIATPINTQQSPRQHLRTIVKKSCIMNATAIDSRIFRNLFGTEEARHIFSDEQYVSRMIDVETALARAQAKAQIIPQTAADSITTNCDVSKLE